MDVKHQNIIKDAQRHYSLLEDWMRRMIAKISKRGMRTELNPGEINSLEEVGRFLNIHKPKAKPEYHWPLQVDV